MMAQLLTAVKRGFKTGSMPWPETHDISVYIVKCSHYQVRNASPCIRPGTGTGISSSHQGKGSYHPKSSHFLLQAPEKGCGHVQHHNGFWFQTSGSNAVKSILKTERTRVFWAIPRSWGQVQSFINFPYQDTSVMTREISSDEDTLMLVCRRSELQLPYTGISTENVNNKMDTWTTKCDNS